MVSPRGICGNNTFFDLFWVWGMAGSARRGVIFFGCLGGTSMYGQPPSLFHSRDIGWQVAVGEPLVEFIDVTIELPGCIELEEVSCCVQKWCIPKIDAFKG